MERLKQYLECHEYFVYEELGARRVVKVVMRAVWWWFNRFVIKPDSATLD